MPTYDYLCEACSHEFEEFQAISAKRLRNCPKCKKPSLKRLIGPGAGVIFKGSGFYQTDYKKTSPTPEKSETPKEPKEPKPPKPPSDKKAGEK